MAHKKDTEELAPKAPESRYERKPYYPPTLRRLGTVRELTQVTKSSDGM